MINVFEIESKWQFLKNKTLYIACSGGVDSMTLLHVFASLKFNVRVLHINYQLRGADSNADEDLVQKTCFKLQVPIEIKRVDTLQILKKSGGNLQDIARKIRYDWFQEVMEASNESFVLLGHHADDQVETFFQHIARKSGIIGMAGMLEQHGRIIRPFLQFDKSDILDFATSNNLVWREDASNAKSDYTRNKLRNLLLPTIEKEIPTIKKSVLLLVNAFQEMQKQLEIDVKTHVEQIHSTGMISHEIYDSLSDFQVVELLRSFSVRASAAVSIQKLRNAQKGKKFQCDGFTISQESTGFEFRKDSREKVFDLKIEKIDHLPQLFSKSVVYLDADLVKGELMLRKWKTGDRISPIGMKGSKLISDILTESKMKSIDRESALVLTDDEEILWCVGRKVSRKCIPTITSKNLLRVEVIPIEK